MPVHGTPATVSSPTYFFYLTLKPLSFLGYLFFFNCYALFDDYNLYEEIKVPSGCQIVIQILIVG